jgi:signal transduction histidine kinase
MMQAENEELRQHSQITKADPDDWGGQQSGWKKDELLALLGHELRNPLAAIRNALQVFGRCGDDNAMREWVREVLERQTDHMGCLIEELLAFSRFRRGKAHAQKGPVDLAQVVALAIDTVRPCIDHRGHVLEVNLPPAPVTLEADPTLLAEVLTNLLGNAAKYTDPGGRIGLTAKVEGDYIVFRVRDSGIGIAPDVLPNVFDLFWQSPSTADLSQAGLGIGLALVRRIVAMHGGNVSAASEGPGQGSEFVVRLPRANLTQGHSGTPRAEERST